jgi:hypothetical protein
MPIDVFGVIVIDYLWFEEPRSDSFGIDGFFYAHFINGESCYLLLCGSKRGDFSLI